jgi:hypothetical protein
MVAGFMHDPMREVEMAIRRVAQHLVIQPHETGLEAALIMVADELEKSRQALANG